MACRLIAYYRVSTKQQGTSGLGLEGQEAAVKAYAARAGCEIIASYTEVESGKRSDRPELAKAMAHSRFAKATLVIAKLDRLSRNVAFLATLMEGGADFVACDMPNANKLTIHIMAAVAEDEARRISERTKTALAAFVQNKHVSKRIRDIYPQGVPAEIVEATAGKLGAALTGSNATPEGRKLGAVRAGKRVADDAVAFNAYIAPRIIDLRSEGKTQQQIADALNAEGVQTRRGKVWTNVQVMRIIRDFTPSDATP